MGEPLKIRLPIRNNVKIFFKLDQDRPCNLIKDTMPNILAKDHAYSGKALVGLTMFHLLENRVR